MKKSRQFLIYALLLVGTALVTAGVAALLVNINQRQTEALQSPLRIVEIGEDELDSSVWGQNFPVHYEMFSRTQENYGTTPYGGSDPYDKLERYPALVQLWAGYAFSIDHNEERGHYYALIDQKETRRVTERQQPGAVEQGFDAFGACPAAVAEEPPEVVDVLLDRQRRIEVAAQPLGVVGDARTDTAAMRRMAHVAAQHGQLTLLKPSRSRDQRQQRRFADPVGADEARHAAGGHAQVDVLQSLQGAVSVPDSGQPDRGIVLGHGRAADAEEAAGDGTRWRRVIRCTDGTVRGSAKASTASTPIAA